MVDQQESILNVKASGTGFRRPTKKYHGPCQSRGAGFFLSIIALRDRNPDIARDVIQGDVQIDMEENQINEDCLKILALHQPVAGDLRRCTAAMMIITDLERMGDLAEEISERAIQLCTPPFFRSPMGCNAWLT